MMSGHRGLRVTVVGFGAMGSGMAKRLHNTGHLVNVYDVDVQRIKDFKDYKTAHPHPYQAPDGHALCEDTSLRGVTASSDIIVICVLNEEQCESVLEVLLPGIKGTTSATGGEGGAAAVTGRQVFILVTSTVAPAYVAALPSRVEQVQSASTGASDRVHRILDAPISGGSVRSELGSLIVMVGAPEQDVDRVRPVLRDMTNYIAPGDTTAAGGYYVCGPKCGDGMTVKICHQLIAGSNLACAAEGYALAKACGVFSDAFVEICTRGAASSFMLQNRGARIRQVLDEDTPPCMSSVGVWKKDLGIVKSLVSKHGLNGRMFEAAFNGFVECGERFGYDKDDSFFTKMLQADSSLSASAGAAVSVEVGDEPRHRVMFENEFVRAINVKIAEGDETMIHTHKVDSLYFFIVPPSPSGNPLGGHTMQVLNTIYDTESNTVTADQSLMAYGECRFGDHCTTPLIHKIKCLRSGNGAGAHCVDVELKKSFPVLDGAHNGDAFEEDGVNIKLVKDKEKARVFQLTIRADSTWAFGMYGFCYMIVVMKGGQSTIQKGPYIWKQNQIEGECEWHSPGEGPWSLRNETPADMILFIIQWK